MGKTSNSEANSSSKTPLEDLGFENQGFTEIKISNPDFKLYFRSANSKEGFNEAIVAYYAPHMNAQIFANVVEEIEVLLKEKEIIEAIPLISSYSKLDSAIPVVDSLRKIGSILDLCFPIVQITGSKFGEVMAIMAQSFINPSRSDDKKIKLITAKTLEAGLELLRADK
jgi:hypothetical protein